VLDVQGDSAVGGEKTVWDHVFPKHRQKSFEALRSVIGPEAAFARARAGSSLLALTWIGPVVIAMATLTKFFGGHLLLGLTLACCACWLVFVYPISRYSRQADRLARRYISAQVGYDIGHITGVASPESWNKSIRRMQKRHDHAAKRHLQE